MPGDFSAEAYEQLRAAYAKETNTQLDAESEGVKILGQEMTLETLPVDSPWKSKIDNWQYPTGRSEYLDGKQDPAEVLAIMRGAAQEIDDAEKLEEAKELVAEAEAEEAEEREGKPCESVGFVGLEALGRGDAGEGAVGGLARGASVVAEVVGARRLVGRHRELGQRRSERDDMMAHDDDGTRRGGVNTWAGAKSSKFGTYDVRSC